MLKTKEVEVILNSKNVEYYESIGYEIPKYINTNNKWTVKRGTKIKVKIDDLLPYSHVDVLVKCDYCGEKYNEVYANYTQCHNKSNLLKDKDCCGVCRGEKQKEINIGLYGKTHPNKYEYDFILKLFLERNYILKTKEENYSNTNDMLEYICLNHIDKGIKTISWGAFYSLNQGCKDCWLDKNKKENHHNWNPNKTDEERKNGRRYFEYIVWRKEVYKKDKYTCQCCGGNEGHNLNAHHLDGYNWCVEKRVDINNGITLCKDCHNDFHHIYGYGDNTKEQYIEWVNNKDLSNNEFLIVS